jgi:hypothetical protein
MRSIVFALALAVPCSAFAATNPMYTNPLTDSHPARAQQKTVFLTFVNFTPQDRELQVGDMRYKIAHTTVLHLYAPVGSVVLELSAEGKASTGKELMEVAATDSGKSVTLR